MQECEYWWIFGNKMNENENGEIDELENLRGGEGGGGAATYGCGWAWWNGPTNMDRLNTLMAYMQRSMNQPRVLFPSMPG